MGQILGLGITHYPGLSAQGNLSRRIKMCLADPALPERFRALENWPEPMRCQWGDDDGQAHWRDTTLDQAEDRGHHELLNWFCLAGAMAELKRKPDEAEFLESWITNSNKVFAVFRPPT